MLTKAQFELRDRARGLAEARIAPRAAAVDRDEAYPWDNVKALTKAGFMGMTIPQAYGGAGLGTLEAALVIEEMAKVCGVTGRIVVEGNMGAVGAIMAFGTQMQKQLAAKLVLAGDKPAICITEPQAGSAATEMTTRADKRGDRYVINGKKHWITGGGVSRLHLIFAQVYDEFDRKQGIGAFLVVRDKPRKKPETGPQNSETLTLQDIIAEHGSALSGSAARRRLRAHFGKRHRHGARWTVRRGSVEHMETLTALGAAKGLIIGHREPAMGLRGIPETEILFNDLEVPEDMALTPPRGLAHGFGDLMRAYNGQRIGAATVALGIAQGAYQLALAYAGERRQFGRPIAEFQGLQWMLADMSVKLEAARGLIHKAAVSRGSGGFPDMLQAAQAKLFAADMAIEVTNNALQIFGAAGYSRARPLERMVRDARMFTIGGGTAQVLRTLIASKILNRRLPQTRGGS
ncbi:MAG: acyl-CoA dehydrogenase family protein [Proteobacteria bacterium]|nr:acyl-CoA dehydrogenase family protein [Pseudomonadota bacterium]